MTTEQKQLVEDAALLLGLEVEAFTSDGVAWVFPKGIDNQEEHRIAQFNPYDPERGDLMRVWLALPECTMGNGYLDAYSLGGWEFSNNDYQSLATAVLCAASAVLKARG